MNMDLFNPYVPGETDGFVFADKQIILNADYHIQDRIPITIAPGTGALDRGTILGVSTADGLWRPVLRTTVAAATEPVNPQVIGLATGTGAMFTVGQTVAAMSATSGTVQQLGTITAINGDNVTVATELTAALAEGDWFYVADGSQTAVGVLADVVFDSTSNKISNAYVAGKFVQSQLVGVDSIVISDLKARQIPYFINDVQDNILVV
ncbi:hypothetical protein NZD89_09290 [Alicyclobacillus fastidiosus]|uniref:Head decoration protein n=1 Tax=Alicyclobacillus fastidiosus TaxID=392011 RepID=A0ABY6ZMY8_9BACL|nr:hypothetical protein [Alicyclobacillus fastidiosus]WAH43551.1 hypothetical protein NZD89_09290 [Alicyclobacillus fastidiosus]GMA59727.1 hypothetical protein GCM10025859_01670 [Alicyclobacillus fastidiosus]GMA65576.1 hypothetical protein GCM10025859_60160 [Alicyclobacillus fastidiosus]